jgi:calcium-dependent protein kinase
VYENERLKAKNEIDILMRLDHPNIVNIYDIFEEDGTITLVLEYMPGGELYNMVSNKTRFSESQVR